MVQYELNLRDYIRIIKKRKLIIISSFIIFSAASFFYINSQVPIYEASTTVKVEERKTAAGMRAEWFMYNPADVLETQAKVIRGFPVMRRAAQTMELINEGMATPEVYEVVRKLQTKVNTEIVGRTNIIRIIAHADIPEEAMNLANIVASSYIEDNLLEKNKQARTARKFIEEQLASWRQRLEKAENELKDFGEEVKNINIAGNIQKKLTELDFKLASLVQKYTKKHPKTLQLKEQIAQLEKQLEGFSGRELQYARLQREVKVNRKIYAMLRERLEQVRITEAEKVSDISVVDPALMPACPVNVQSNLTMTLGGFLGLVIGMVLSFFAESLDTSMGTIEDVENVVKLNVLCIVPSIRKDVSKSFKYWNKLRRMFFPKDIRGEDIRYARLVSHYKPTSPITEAFRNIKTNIKFSLSRKIILITSAGPQEGKTTVLVNLGLVSAQEGVKTLLVSSDLRRPNLAGSFGLDEKPGLSNIVMGTTTFKQALRNASDMMLGDIDIEELLKHPGLDHLWILPSGPLPLNPTEILDSKEIDGIIDSMRKEFDVIIFDSPPVLPVADASVLASKVDGVVLCYESGRTSRHALLRSKSQIESAGGNILGIVLNHTQPETEPLEAYPYYYKYKYRYYGKESNSQKNK